MEEPHDDEPEEGSRLLDRGPAIEIVIALLLAVVMLLVVTSFGAETSPRAIDGLRDDQGRWLPDSDGVIDAVFPVDLICGRAGRCVPLPAPACAGTEDPEPCTLPDGRTPFGGRFRLVMRVEQRPAIGPQAVRDAVAGREKELAFPGTGGLRGTLTGADLARIAEGLGPEFWTAVNDTAAIQPVLRRYADRDDPSFEAVPIVATTRYLTCREPAARIVPCRPATTGGPLPIGAPVYSLQPDVNWMRRTPSAQTDFNRLLDQVDDSLARSPTEEEFAVLLVLAGARPFPKVLAVGAPVPEIR